MMYVYNIGGIAAITNELALVPLNNDYIEIEELPEKTSDYGHYFVDFSTRTLIWIETDPPEVVAEPTDLTEAKIQALTDQQSFLEDCIAEMAEIVYA